METSMGYLNCEFFDEFKLLDNLCNDMYGKSTDNKLGVTLYLEDMDRKSYQGAFKTSSWSSDYNRLKSLRKLRNDLAHSYNSMTIDICSQEDIDFVRSFREKILNQTDPIAVLNKQSPQSHHVEKKQIKQQPLTPRTHTARDKTYVGCLGIAALFLLAGVCIIAFLLLHII